MESTSVVALGVILASLAYLSCVTPLAVVILGSVGLSAWTGRLDVVALPMPAAFLALAVYRYHVARRRTP